MPELDIDRSLPRLKTLAEREAAWQEVREAARTCTDCPLFEIGTQTVFGVGPINARLMFIGEAPGAQEDKAGRPFVGPAGKLFDEALQHAGIDRDEVYVTNTVKHRPWIAGPTGRQKNRAPKQSEINACRQWHVREVDLTRPELVVCLGAKAATEILGRDFKLTQQRGQWHSTSAARHVLATLHPSYVLIQPRDSYDRVRDTFFSDFTTVAERYRDTRRAA
ncbi:MAG TPA: UdgX family uracil-DNA binding protein [Chloroflexota bacterium]|nr:UdgX family uracil-DNA binding protein [Chloroflexota bacterium]